MLNSNFSGETMIFKNDKGFYSTTLSKKNQDGTYANAYISVGFRKGVDIPNNKRVEIALTYIYGIGRSLSNKILEAANVDKDKKAEDLTNEEISRIRDEVNKYQTEGELRREVNMNIKTKMEINSYEGTRHKKGLPVRGQRTNRNARTRKGKGKVVANKKK